VRRAGPQQLGLRETALTLLLVAPGTMFAIGMESSSISLRRVVFTASIRQGCTVGPLYQKSASADKDCSHRKGGGSEQCRLARRTEKAK
jgi:hypothetical protein